MTVNGTSGGTLNTLLASNNNLGGGLPAHPPSPGLLHLEGAAGWELGDEEPGGGAGGDYYGGGGLQEGHCGGGGGWSGEGAEWRMVGLLLLDGQAGLRLDAEEGVLGGAGGHRLHLDVARVENEIGGELCVHF